MGVGDERSGVRIGITIWEFAERCALSIAVDYAESVTLHTPNTEVPRELAWCAQTNPVCYWIC